MYRENLHRQQFYHKYIFRLEEGICFLSFNLNNHRFFMSSKSFRKKKMTFSLKQITCTCTSVLMLLDLNIYQEL